MRRRGAAVAGALGALALVAVAAWLGQRDDPAAPAGTRASWPVPGSPHASTANGPSSTSRAALAGPASEEWKADDLPATAARRLAEARDKRAFYDRALKVGGGAYLVQARAVLDQCSIVSRYGMAGAEQAMVSRGIQDGAHYAERVASFRAHIEGCEGFETRKVGSQDYVALLKRIREQDDLASRAYSLRPGALTTPQLQTGAQLLALKALDTGDAYLLNELAQYFAFRQAGLLGSPRLASSADPRIDAMQSERDAWIWAACELGVDCGPTSANGRRVCFEMAKCEWKNIGEIAGDIFAPPGKAPPRERKDEIVAAVRTRDWTKLGF